MINRRWQAALILQYTIQTGVALDGFPTQRLKHVPYTAHHKVFAYKVTQGKTRGTMAGTQSWQGVAVVTIVLTHHVVATSTP